MTVQPELAPRRPRFRLEPYVQFAQKAAAREATYRFDVFTTIASVLVRVYLLRMVWVALYARNVTSEDLPLHAIITYSTVALLMGLVMDIDQTRMLHDKLHSGGIATDFMKPINVPLYFFSDGSGEVLFHAVLIVPSLLFSLLIVHIDVPGPLVLATFFVSFFLGLPGRLLRELHHELHRVLDAGDPRGAAHRDVGQRPVRRRGHPAGDLPGAVAEDRVRAAVRRDVLHAAADLRRRDQAGRATRRRWARRCSGWSCWGSSRP